MFEQKEDTGGDAAAYETCDDLRFLRGHLGEGLRGLLALKLIEEGFPVVRAHRVVSFKHFRDLDELVELRGHKGASFRDVLRFPQSPVSGSW